MRELSAALLRPNKVDKFIFAYHFIRIKFTGILRLIIAEIVRLI